MAIMMPNTELHILPDPNEVFLSAAEDFTRRAIAAVRSKGIFTVVLSGGNTPKAFFDMLASPAKKYHKEIPWPQIRFFFSDERYVSAEDAASNYHMAKVHLFSKLPIALENIYRMPTTEFSDPKEAAKAYEAILRKAFGLKEDHLFPVFDLVYLGLGEDAHTASLMPFSDIVKNYSKNKQENYLLTAALWVPKLNMYRITLTPPTINHAECIIFLVTGESKATAVQVVLEGNRQAEQYPAQLIQSIHGKTIWMLDQAAGSRLAKK